MLYYTKAAAYGGPLDARGDARGGDAAWRVRNLLLVRMECPAWRSGSPSPLIAGCLSLQQDRIP